MAILECRQLTKRYSAQPALDHIDLTVQPGGIVGLLGPNGSGKTTLLKLANGLLQPDSGEILIDGKKPSKETKSIVSYLPERTYFADWMRTEQLLDLFQDFYTDFDRKRAEEMLQHMNIQPKMRIKEMSKGMREKVQLILVMSRRAKLYLLDERGFAAAVRSQQTDDASGLNLEVNMIQGRLRAVALCQLPAFQNCHIFIPSFPFFRSRQAFAAPRSDQSLADAC